MSGHFAPSFINADNEVALFIDRMPTAPATLAMPESNRITINPGTANERDIRLGPQATRALAASATVIVFELDDNDTPVRHRKFHLGGD